jgi:hypothetical protein
MSQQLKFPFLQQGDECDALAHMLTAKVVNIVQAMAPPEFRWTPGADLEISRVRAAIAEDLRTLLKEAERVLNDAAA